MSSLGTGRRAPVPSAAAAPEVGGAVAALAGYAARGCGLSPFRPPGFSASTQKKRVELVRGNGYVASYPPCSSNWKLGRWLGEGRRNRPCKSKMFGSSNFREACRSGIDPESVKKNVWGAKMAGFTPCISAISHLYRYLTHTNGHEHGGSGEEREWSPNGVIMDNF